jgi:hypothetical protein
MANEYQLIREWAVNNVADQKQRKAILKDLKSAFAKDTKAKAWFTSLYRLGEHDNLVNAVRSIPIYGRTITETSQSCWMCGQSHNDTYLGEFKGAKVSIGNVCARTRLTRYGGNAGVLTDAEEKTRKQKAKQVQEDLEILVSEEENPVVLLDHKPAKKKESYLGTLVGWVLQQENAPDNVLAAADRIKNSYSRSARNDVRILLDHVAKTRKFPADAFEPIAKDIELMENEKLAPAGLAQRIRSAKELTGAQADLLLAEAKENHRQYRIRKNTEFLKNYEPGNSLATIIEQIAPVFEQHDKPLWREDLAAQMFRYNKVLSAQDYRLVARCLKRWTFSSTQPLEGADRLRLRNIAVRIEPVSDFRQIIDGLVAISRKLQYSKDHVNDDERQQLESIKAEINRLPDKQKYAMFRKFADQLAQKINDPCTLLKAECYALESLEEKTGIADLNALVSKASRTYAPGDKIWDNNHQKAARAAEHVQYGIVSKEDIIALQTLERRAKHYFRIESMYLKKDIRALQEATSSKLVVGMPFLEDREAFRNATTFGQQAVRALFRQVYITKGSLAREAVGRLAAGEYAGLKRKLQKTGLTEERVLAIRQELGNTVNDAQVRSGEHIKYICPVKVKQFYDARKAP